MNPNRLRELLEQVRHGALSPDQALVQLKGMPFEDLGFAKIDHHRALRKGFPEVIFGAGKTAAQIAEIALRLGQGEQNVLITRLEAATAAAVSAALPELLYNEHARVATLLRHPVEITGRGTILVVCAGTSDLPVAEEAALTAELLGNRVERLHDVGVAGIHRLLARQELLNRASVVIVVAGMEGALPSVVGGLVGVPVIAVPTSIGYGASFGGLAALLAMLNSCAAGITVVNIDNGFGAGVAASLINRAVAGDK
ncbi:MAG: nickel pincer cofactor biosynthesis protein LarB [Deltaproteobacteria bacterium]|nr:nickel pincer cofactor biosynthesis protein LarB [Deltaproteobacteria bacterium]